MAGEPRGIGQLGRHRIRDHHVGRRGRTAPGTADPRTGRRASYRLRTHGMDSRTGRRRAVARRNGPHQRGYFRTRHSAHPNGGHACAQAPGPRPHRSSAGRDRRPLTGRQRGGVTQGSRRARRRVARHRPVDRCRRIARLAPPRHGRAGGQVPDGFGHQRRPGTVGRTSRRLRPRRAHRVAARAVHSQRQAVGGYHRNARAVGPVRALLPEGHRERRSRAQEQDPRRRCLRAGFQPGQCRGRVPYAAVGRRRRARRRMGSAHRSGS